ncbi:MAG TPA: hypothetical protein ENI95_14555 [Chloroflexi bacterium]|nr:hypothetical protein [Chloroflexota bacterium]
MNEVYAHSRVTTVSVIRRKQLLPLGGAPRVAKDQSVRVRELIAVTEVPTGHRLINAAAMLRIPPEKLGPYLVKQEGELVEKGEVLASRRVRFRLRPLQVVAPIDGYIRWVGDGRILLEGTREQIEVYSPVPGRVFAVKPEEYIIIESRGAEIQIAWASGDPIWGTLKLMDSEPSLTTETGRFNIDHRGAVVAIGSPLTREFLQEAVDIRVKGLIAPSMHASLIPLVGEAGIPVGLTQGFGHLPMSERIFSLLKTYNGRELALDVRAEDWRETRPAIIIPIDSLVPPDDQGASQTFKPGSKVRVLQPPYRGEIGTIKAIPETPRRLESGLWLPGAFVEVPSGETVYVPFANLEHLG